MKEQKLDRFSVAGSCKTETGMYDPRFEHDNCGIGAVVNIKGIKTHATVENALKIVENLKHRAGKDAEGKTGDGVGILLQVSHKFFSKVTKPLGIELGEERDYGVGMFFFPQDELKRNQAKKMFEVIVNKEGMEKFQPIRPNSDRKQLTVCRILCRALSNVRQKWQRDLILTANCMWQDVFLNSPTMILMWFLYPAEPSYTKVCS